MSQFFISQTLRYRLNVNNSMIKVSYGKCTRREFLREILYKNIAIIAIQHSKMDCVDNFGDFSHTFEWNSLKSVWQISLYILAQTPRVEGSNYYSIVITHKNPQSARRKPNYRTKCGKNCHKILSVYSFTSYMLNSHQIVRYSYNCIIIEYHDLTWLSWFHLFFVVRST